MPRRVVINKAGGVSAIAVQSMDMPEPGKDEVRIRVVFAGINFADLLMRMGFYNPRSNARPEGFGRALRLLQQLCDNQRPIIFARAVSTEAEAINILPLQNATPEMADMRTVVLLGSSTTRLIERVDKPPLVYTPRSVPS